MPFAHDGRGEAVTIEEEPPVLSSLGGTPATGRIAASRAALLNLAANVALGGLGVLTGLLAARMLGATGRGQLAEIQLWPTMIATLAVLGFPEALAYFSARNRSRAGRYLVSAMVLATPAGGVAVVLGYFLLPLLITGTAPSVLRDARIYLLIIPIFIIVGLAYHPLRGTGHFVSWNILRVLPSVIWLVVLLGFLLLGRATPGGLAIAYLPGLALLAVPIAVVIYRSLDPPFLPLRSEFRPLLGFGLPAMLTTLPQTLNLRLDQLLMVSLVSSRQLGLYVVAVAWSGVVNPVVGAIGLAVVPRIAGVEDQHDRTEFLVRSSRISILVGAAIATVMVCLTPIALPFVFGSSFSAGVVTAVVLLPAAIILSWNFVIAEGLRGLGRPRGPLYAEAAGLAATAAGLALLLPWLGILGAAITSLVSYAIVAAWQVRLLRRTVEFNLRGLLCPTPADLRLLMSGLRTQLIRGAVKRRDSSGNSRKDA